MATKGTSAILRFDGASRGNPGKAASAAILISPLGAVLRRAYRTHDLPTTCNVAEYLGLIAGMRIAVEHGVSRLIVEGDSKLVIEQVFGTWECRHPRLRALCQTARNLKNKFETLDGRWIPREQNGGPDALCNTALDTGACEGVPTLFEFNNDVKLRSQPMPIKPAVLLQAFAHKKRPYSKTKAPSILEQLGIH